MMKKLLPVMVFALVLFAGVAHAGQRMESVLIPNGLAHAQLGDWITFKMGDGTTQKHSVIERLGDTPTSEIVTRIETFKNGEIQGSKRVRQAIGEELVKPPVPDGEEHAYETRKETVTFEGAALAIDIIDVYDAKSNKLLRTWYLSPELPMYGVIKKVFADGSPEFEVIDFGFADGEKTAAE